MTLVQHTLLPLWWHFIKPAEPRWYWSNAPFQTYELYWGCTLILGDEIRLWGFSQSGKHTHTHTHTLLEGTDCSLSFCLWSQQGSLLRLRISTAVAIDMCDRVCLGTFTASMIMTLARAAFKRPSCQNMNLLFLSEMTDGTTAGPMEFSNSFITMLIIEMVSNNTWWHMGKQQSFHNATLNHWVQPIPLQMIWWCLKL